MYTRDARAVLTIRRGQHLTMCVCCGQYCKEALRHFFERFLDVFEPWAPADLATVSDPSSPEPVQRAVGCKAGHPSIVLAAVVEAVERISADFAKGGRTVDQDLSYLLLMVSIAVFYAGACLAELLHRIRLRITARGGQLSTLVDQGWTRIERGGSIGRGPLGVFRITSAAHAH